MKKENDGGGRLHKIYIKKDEGSVLALLSNYKSVNAPFAVIKGRKLLLPDNGM